MVSDKIQSNYEKEIRAALEYHDDFFKRSDDSYSLFCREKKQVKNTKKKELPLFWSNVNTVLPNLFFKNPTTYVVRDNYDADTFYAECGKLIEMSSEHNLKGQRFRETMRDIVQDYLVIGRGVPWIKYTPTFKDEQIQAILTDDGSLLLEDDSIVTIEDAESYGWKISLDNETVIITREVLVKEQMLLKRVHHRDFIHNQARCWEEVKWVAIANYMTKSEAKEQLGVSNSKVEDLVYNYGYDDDNKTHVKTENARGSEDYEMTRVWELWDSRTKRIYYITDEHSGYEILKAVKPAIDYQNFFPCPPPLTATCRNDCILPYSDISYYSSAQLDLNIITTRKSRLQNAIKAVGAYDKAHKDDISQLFNATNDTWVPISNWQALDGAGIRGLLDVMPLDLYAQGIAGLTEAKVDIKEDIYEITGISDIIRGESDPRETATAQNTKSQHAKGRFKERQETVTNFVKNCIEIMCEGIAEKFTDSTIADGCNYKADDPKFQQMLQIIRSDKMRTFNLDIETDSTIFLDEQKEKAESREYAQIFGELFDRLVALKQAAPEAIPAWASTAKAVLARYSKSIKMQRDAETAIDSLAQAAQQAAQQQQQMAQQAQQQEMALKERQIALQEAAAAQKEREQQIQNAAIAITKQEADTNAFEARSNAEIKEREVRVKETTSAAKIIDDKADNVRADRELEIKAKQSRDELAFKSADAQADKSIKLTDIESKELIHRDKLDNDTQNLQIQQRNTER